uniref:Transmembrane protein n=1 Tax=Kalanchoe fedtschenkoi TaxID=63787 RepID=A0A7N0TT33_KALFE
MALKWTTTLSVVVVFAAAVAATSAFSVHVLKKKCKKLLSKIGELEDSLTASLRKRDAERQGRIRAQQALRATLTKPNCDDLKNSSYPMTPIGVVESCFSTRCVPGNIIFCVGIYSFFFWKNGPKPECYASSLVLVQSI